MIPGSLPLKVVLFDIDHTVRDAARRDHMLAQCKITDLWDDYHNDGINDGVCADVHAMLTCFRHCGYPVVGVTAIPEKYKDITKRWLREKCIWLDDLLMHKRDNWEPSGPLKIALVKERYGEDFAEKILMIVDDHAEVVKMFQQSGVTALQVHGRKYNND